MSPIVSDGGRCDSSSTAGNSCEIDCVVTKDPRTYCHGGKPSASTRSFSWACFIATEASGLEGKSNEHGNKTDSVKE